MTTSWFTQFEGLFVTTEQQVVQMIVQGKQGVDVAMKDIHAAIAWAANEAPTVAAGIQSVLSIVQVLGVVNPQVEVAVAAANAAVVALNAFAAAEKAGNSDITSVVSGYTAVQQARAAVANASAAAAQAKSAVPAAVVAAA